MGCVASASMTGDVLGTGSMGAVASGSTASARTTSMGSVVDASLAFCDPLICCQIDFPISTTIGRRLSRMPWMASHCGFALSSESRDLFARVSAFGPVRALLELWQHWRLGA